MFLLRIRHFADAMFFARANDDQRSSAKKSEAFPQKKSHTAQGE